MVLIFITVVVSAASFFVYRYLEKKGSPAPQKAIGAWRGVVPGQSSVNELYQKAGTPVSSSQDSSGATLSYPTENKYWTSDVSVSQDKVTFIKERIFAPAELSLKKRLEETGKDWIKIYGPGSQFGSFLFAYPALGTAYYADEGHDVVYEVWRFQPTTPLGLLALPQAQGFSATFQPRQD